MHTTSVRSRINSLDPSQLSRAGEKPHASSLPVPAKSGRERDPSPLGRAVSILSQGSHGEGHGHHHHLFHRRPKIPKPTAEQVAYIKKVLVDIPGPASVANGPPAGLRVAHPPGSRPSSSNTDAGTTSDSGTSSVATSLSQLDLSAPIQAPKPVVSWQDTDLFECFRQFTSVEVLEGENSFACQNCWKWLNPELEAKRKADKAQRRAERAERRRVRRAVKRGEDPRALATPCASEHGAVTTDDDDERDPAADRTARNTPSHSPRLGSTFTPLSTIPPIEPLDGSKVVASDPENLESNAVRTETTASSSTRAGGGPTRNLSMSSAATSSHSEMPSISTDYEGGISSEAFETTTDEGEDGYESEASPGLDDAASLSGSLSALPPQGGTPLTSSALNAQQQQQQHPGQPMGRTISQAVSESLQAQIKPLPPPRGGPPPKITSKELKSPSNGHSSNGKDAAKSPAAGGKTRSKVPPRKQRHILRRAHKRYLISPTDLPPVLVVHLKRFMQTSKSSLFGSAFVNLKKRDDPVSFPREMDLTPFLAPSGKPPRLNPNAFGSDERGRGGAPRAEENGGHDHHHRQHKVELEKETHNARYRLYAVVVHFGDLNTGTLRFKFKPKPFEKLMLGDSFYQVITPLTCCRTGTARATKPVGASAAGCFAPTRTSRLSVKPKSCARKPTCCAFLNWSRLSCGEFSPETDSCHRPVQVLRTCRRQDGSDAQLCYPLEHGGRGRAADPVRKQQQWRGRVVLVAGGSRAVGLDNFHYYAFGIGR